MDANVALAIVVLFWQSFYQSIHGMYVSNVSDTLPWERAVDKCRRMGLGFATADSTQVTSCAGVTHQFWIGTDRYVSVWKKLQRNLNTCDNPSIVCAVGQVEIESVFCTDRTGTDNCQPDSLEEYQNKLKDKCTGNKACSLDTTEDICELTIAYSCIGVRVNEADAYHECSTYVCQEEHVKSHKCDSEMPCFCDNEEVGEIIKMNFLQCQKYCSKMKSTIARTLLDRNYCDTARSFWSDITRTYIVTGVGNDQFYCKVYSVVEGIRQKLCRESNRYICISESETCPFNSASTTFVTTTSQTTTRFKTSATSSAKSTTGSDAPTNTKLSTSATTSAKTTKRSDAPTATKLTTSATTSAKTTTRFLSDSTSSGVATSSNMSTTQSSNEMKTYETDDTLTKTLAGVLGAVAVACIALVVAIICLCRRTRLNNSEATAKPKKAEKVNTPAADTYEQSLARKSAHLYQDISLTDVSNLQQMETYGQPKAMTSEHMYSELDQETKSAKTGQPVSNSQKYMNVDFIPKDSEQDMNFDNSKHIYSNEKDLVNACKVNQIGKNTSDGSRSGDNDYFALEKPASADDTTYFVLKKS